MKDDPDFNIKFVEFIEERPCLYNFNRPDYSDKNSQDAAWLEIAENVNESIADCKERWKNLRGCYTRHLKKKNRPSGSSKKHVKPYYLADNMQFLYRYTKSRPSKDPIIKREQEINHEIDDNLEDVREFEPAPSHFHFMDIHKSETYEAENFPRPNQTLNKSKKVSSSDFNSIANSVGHFQSMQKIAKLNDPDPDLAFLHSLLPDVKDMDREQKRRFKMGVLQLAGDILQVPASQN